MIIDEPEMPRVSRSSNDVLRLVVAVIVLVVAVLSAIFSADTIQAVERDVLTVVGNLPRALENFVVASIQVGCLYAPIVLVLSMLVLRRFRRLGVAVVAAGITSLALRGATLIVDSSGRGAPPLQLLGPLLSRGLRSTADVPSITYVAVTMALATVEGPWLTRPWRRATRVIVVAVAFAHLAARDSADRSLPVDLGIALAVGWVVGLALLLALGRPNRRARGRDVVSALAGFGLHVAEVRAVRGTGNAGRAYRVRCRDGAWLDVKLTNADDQGSHILQRAYRFVRVRDIGDEHPFWSPLRAREHEALLAFSAREAGVCTPRVRAVGSARAGDAALLAWDAVASGVLISTLPDAALGGAPVDADDATRSDDRGDDNRDDNCDDSSDDTCGAALLARVWAEAAQLRRHHIAHRDLHLGNFLRDERGAVWVINFEAAQLQADSGVLANDVAELLTSTAVRAGPERAVASAVDALGPDAVASALPRLQPLALSRVTRNEAKVAGTLLDDVAAEVCRATGAAPVPLEQLQRLRLRTILLFFMSAFALYAVLPFVADASSVAAEVRNADYTWFAVALLASALSYLAAAIALTGAVPGRVRFSTTVVAQIASQFVNFATPASVGGMALNVRFLQKQGTDPPVAVASVGLDVVAGFVVHVALLFGVIVWAGSDGTISFGVPDPLAVAAVAAFLIGLMALAVIIRPSRHMLVDRGWPIVKRSLLGIVEVARRPIKLLQLLGGSALLTVTYAAALVASVYAFGGDLPVATIALVFLAGSAVASVAPTPGGLGAVEAALVGGLTAVGLDGSTAVSAVVIFRLATFWLPLAPGWVAFRHLEHRDAI